MVESGAVAEEEKGDLLPVAGEVDDMFAIPDDDEEDDQDGERDDDADLETGWQRKSVGLPSTLPQIA